MRKVAFIIDGWFMRKRIFSMKSFLYTGPEIRKYCKQHLKEEDSIYRIFYYDTEPIRAKGHNPVSKEFIDFGQTPVAKRQDEFLRTIKRTPNFALRLGKSEWQNRNWMLRPGKLRDLLTRSIKVDDLTENDVVPHIEQKAVDMKMGMDIALLAMKKQADVLIVISGDADIVPALKLARREGMIVGLDPLWHPIKDDLAEHVDFIATHVPRPEPEE